LLPRVFPRGWSHPLLSILPLTGLWRRPTHSALDLVYIPVNVIATIMRRVIQY
jgi:hypothetical protein